MTCPPGLDDWTLNLCQAGNLVTIPLGADLAYWAAGLSRQAPFRDEQPGRAARMRDRFADATAVLDQVTDDAAVQFSAADKACVEDPVAGHVSTMTQQTSGGWQGYVTGREEPPVAEFGP